MGSGARWLMAGSSSTTRNIVGATSEWVVVVAGVVADLCPLPPGEVVAFFEDLAATASGAGLAAADESATGGGEKEEEG